MKKKVNTTILSLLACCCLILVPVGATAIQNVDLSEKIKPVKRLGDFEDMVKRRVIRVLVPYSKTFYFLDGATPRGSTYEMLVAFEKAVNKRLKTRHLKVHLFIIPTPRDRLIPNLVAGFGDMAAGNLTITKQRLKQVDFSDPFLRDIDEILVTHKDAPGVKDRSELAGKKIWVRESSSYFSSLIRMNKTLAKTKKKKIRIRKADEFLEDEDLIEMVAADLIPRIVVDSHKAEFWADIYKGISVHPDITFRENGRIAWAIRKDSPRFKQVINEFVKKNKKGTLFGNIIFNRYLKKNKYVRNNLATKERKRFEQAVSLFKKYGNQYRYDHLMLAALAYQESRIDQSKVSHTGAVGVMQILPTTARDKNVGIPDIDRIEPNIHAGTKYLRFLADRYFNEPGIDPFNRMLLSFAAYNAGPARIKKLREEARSLDLNPNVWFRNVEVVAARRIGRETVQYVSNIVKYYLAYSLIADKEAKKASSIESLKKQ